MWEIPDFMVQSTWISELNFLKTFPGRPVTIPEATSLYKWTISELKTEQTKNKITDQDIYIPGMTPQVMTFQPARWLDILDRDNSTSNLGGRVLGGRMGACDQVSGR
jgi:hypothetical protein